jgi:hypothetical protein
MIFHSFFFSFEGLESALLIRGDSTATLKISMKETKNHELNIKFLIAAVAPHIGPFSKINLSHKQFDDMNFTCGAFELKHTHSKTSP